MSLLISPELLGPRLSAPWKRPPKVPYTQTFGSPMRKAVRPHGLQIKLKGDSGTGRP